MAPRPTRTLVCALALAACGGGDDTPRDGDTPRLDAATAAICPGVDAGALSSVRDLGQTC